MWHDEEVVIYIEHKCYLFISYRRNSAYPILGLFSVLFWSLFLFLFGATECDPHQSLLAQVFCAVWRWLWIILDGGWCRIRQASTSFTRSSQVRADSNFQMKWWGNIRNLHKELCNQTRKLSSYCRGIISSWVCMNLKCVSTKSRKRCESKYIRVLGNYKQCYHQVSGNYIVVWLISFNFLAEHQFKRKKFWSRQ